MATNKNTVSLFCFILLFLGFSNMNFAQTESTTKTKKTIVITKTIDENGHEKTTKVITEGGDDMSADDIDALIEKTLKEEGIDAEVDVTIDGDKKEAEKEMTVIIKNKGEIQETDEEETMMFKTEDGKDINIEDMEDNTEIIIEEEIIEKDGKIEKRIKKIKRGGKPNGAFLGVMLDGETEGVVKVMDTVEGSAAEKAGLQKGDVLKTVNGQNVSSHQSLVDAMAGKKAKDKVQITYERAGETMTTEAVLTAYKGEMKIMKMGSDMEDDENIWIDDNGKVIELEDGKKMIMIEKDGTTTKTTKKVIKKNGTVKKTIEIEVETEEEKKGKE